MKLDDTQLELPVADVYVRRMRAAKLKAACRVVSATRGFADMAAELDAVFCSEGRPVSVGMLHNTLNPDHERNYARMEWLPIFAEYSEDVAEILANAAGRTLAPLAKLTPEAELELLRDRVMREFGAAGARLISNLAGGGRRR
jgi:hypothetical protein